MQSVDIREKPWPMPIDWTLSAAMSAFGITQKKLDALKTACDAARLPDAAHPIVLNATIDLARFQSTVLLKRKSPKEKFNSMDAVRVAAVALQKAINDLEFGELQKLDSAFWNGHSALHVSLATGSLVPQIDALLTVAGAAEVAAGVALATIPAKGRKALQTLHMGHIAGLAFRLQSFGLKPYVGGPFNELCNAVFSAAGVHAKADGSLRLFEEEVRKENQAKNYCL